MVRHGEHRPRRKVLFVTSRQARRGAPERFGRYVEALTRVRTRPEVALNEIPAPQRIAPHSIALSADVTLPGEEEPVASGRFIVLHDPGEPEAWDGAWRLVTYATCRLDPDMAAEPLLSEVGWSWLCEALDEAEVPYRALGGTVTRVISEGFGSLADRQTGVEMEVRASWTVEGTQLGEHLRLWTGLLCTMAGLPPLPDGVVPLPGIRR